MTRAVLDTNVLVSGFVRSNADAATVRVLDLWRSGAFDLVTSAPIIEEFRRTLSTPYFISRLSPEDIEAAVALIATLAELVEIVVEVSGVATHREDDVILATAVSAGANFLVTGDRQLRKVAEFNGVRLVTPAEFAGWLRGE